MTDRRSRIAGLVAGLLLLVLMVGFAVGLPAVTGDGEDAGATSGEAVELPDTLPGGLVAQDGDQAPDPQGIDPAEYRERLEILQASAGDTLTEVFEAPAAFRVYTSTDGAVQALVTVLDQAPGLFAPDGPPVSAEASEVARPASELVRTGDAVCAINWGEAVPIGQPVDDSATPAATRCQLGAGDRTYEMAATGLGPDQVVGALQALADDQA